MSRSERAIIGGARVVEGEHPTAGFLWGMIEVGGDLFPLDGCSGTLIAPDTVLTAAHCVADFPGIPPTSALVYTTQLDAIEAFTSPLPPSELREGSYLSRDHVHHPDFSFLETPMRGLERTDDIALVFLDEPVSGVTPAALPEGFDLPALSEGTEVLIVGYGLTSADGGSMNDPPGLGANAFLKHAGESLITEVGPFEMRVGRTSPEAPLIPQKCSGDSGGPTYIERPGLPPIVVGVTSRSYDQVESCASGGVDVRVDAYLEWLRSEMEAACAEGRRPGTPDAPCDGDGEVDAGVPLDMGAPDLGAPDLGDNGTDQPDAGTPELGPDAGASSPPITPDLLDDGSEGCSAGGQGGSLWPLLGLIGLFARSRGYRGPRNVKHL